MKTFILIIVVCAACALFTTIGHAGSYIIVQSTSGKTYIIDTTHLDQSDIWLLDRKGAVNDFFIQETINRAQKKAKQEQFKRDLDWQFELDNMLREHDKRRYGDMYGW